jgi:hypothetical protein
MQKARKYSPKNLEANKPFFVSKCSPNIPTNVEMTKS